MFYLTTHLFYGLKKREEKVYLLKKGLPIKYYDTKVGTLLFNDTPDTFSFTVM